MEDKNNDKSEAALREERILEFWEKNKIFEKSLEKPAPRGEFIFYEGPPTANGYPGIHHLESRAFKDLIPRFKTMQGFFVPRRAGWDTHGLPVEIEVEKELGIKSKKEIEELGITEFNKKCKESVNKYVKKWGEFTDRIGFWLDQENSYSTFNPSYMESIWSIIKKIEDQGLLYKDYKVLPWCPRCETALSSHELAQGYKGVEDPAVFIKFKQIDKDEYFLAWTTTPWTLPGNIALAVGEAVDYVKVKVDGEDLWLAKSRAKEILPNVKILEEIKGKYLIGRKYEPLFSYLSDLLPENEKFKLMTAYQIYPADFVSTEEGTGIVHTAVMYGADDFDLGTKFDLPKYHLINEKGEFIKETGTLAGKFVKDADKNVIEELKKKNLLFKEERITHTYPFCWRCQTPLIYFARDSWYIRVSNLRQKLIDENQKIHWEPEYIKNGRFGEWLREVKDWAISRERYWGTPLPIWQCNNCDHKEVIGSIEDIKKKTTNGNKYFVMRHGEALNNTENIASGKNPKWDKLTDNGKEQVKNKIPEIEKLNIDFIISSPFNRTKQTSEIISKGIGNKEIVFDERMEEIDIGVFEDKDIKEYRKFNSTIEEHFIKRPENGENLMDVKCRVGDFIYEINKKYNNKNILVVAHSESSFMLFSSAHGLTQQETKDLLDKDDENITFINNAEIKELDFSPIPHNEEYELDLHRPYIDRIVWKCEKCKGEMERVKEIIDVWFDSGAMPFAQDHYPFENKNFVDEFGYPGDYIAEAIDQTRGWFYTLHAIGILMEKGKAYKNVVCLGHILDSKGKKMSKSIGNMVNPWEMIDKYGVDTLRLWMYSVNQPGEPKNFDEITVKENKRILTILENIVKFYELYKENASRFSSGWSSSNNVLDDWILTKLNKLIFDSTNNLNNYKILEPTREIKDFILDFSQWYIRRSRDRLKSENENDKQSALITTKFVLLELSKLMAPFTPFMAENVYKRTGGDLESVHLEKWPSVLKTFWGKVKVDLELIEEMKKVRKIVSFGLEAREKEGIKVRQPLSEIQIKKNLSKKYFDLIKDELNVKEVIFDSKMKEEIKLNTNISPELKQEGQFRELTRSIQESRKKENLTPSDQIILTIETNKDGQELIKKFENNLKKVVLSKEIKFEQNNSEEIMINNLSFKIKIEK